MTEQILGEVRSSCCMKNAIIGGISLDTGALAVNIKLITDSPYTRADYDAAYAVLRRYVPQEFSFELGITKVSPDEAMVKGRITGIIEQRYPAVYSVMAEGDVAVRRTEGGFDFTVATVLPQANAARMVADIEGELKKQFCGQFSGRAAKAQVDLSSIEIEQEEAEPEYVFRPRTFPVCNFVPIETVKSPERAVYIADFDYASESTYVCGYITDVTERTYEKNGAEKSYYIFSINDGTGELRIRCFARKKSLEKIRALAAGEGIVCECRSELYRGSMSYTSINIDRGTPPENFVPEKRPARPVPLHYGCVKPRPFTDYTQSDMFSDSSLPACLKNNTFVVFDLETTGLQSSGDDMDGIIEIGAYKIEGGEIREKFSTFVNPLRKSPLPQKIVELTGITDEQVNSAPSYKDVMPDFVKFCDGAILVGHNVVNFDFRFVDHYAKSLGYEIERRLIDTLNLSQSMLRLANNKLDTVAEHFGITFNHHRAEDDALATAKIFIELIKIKKSLPTLL